MGVLNRMSFILDAEKKTLIFSEVIKSHFSLFLLIRWLAPPNLETWLAGFTNGPKNSVYNDTGVTFRELIQLCKRVSVCHKNMQILTTHVKKIVNYIFSLVMKRFFDFRENNQKTKTKKPQTKKRKRFKILKCLL